MGDKITKEKILRIERQIRREEAVAAGYYDGRHGHRVHKDKKKERSRRKCREKQEQTDW
jgi:hypothetical protein